MNFIILRAASATSSADQLIRSESAFPLDATIVCTHCLPIRKQNHSVLKVAPAARSIIKFTQGSLFIKDNFNYNLNNNIMDNFKNNFKDNFKDKSRTTSWPTSSTISSTTSRITSTTISCTIPISRTKSSSNQP